MQIANPIYDTIFKYLMENVEIAKIILSAILNEQILSVEVKPQEMTVNVKSKGKKVVRVIRLDFKATIQSTDGTLKKVLIEIQKAKKGSEIKRFRRYLGENYMEEDKVGKNSEDSLPITSIFFLGYRLKYIRFPALKVGRTFMNAITRRMIRTPFIENFVEQLSHDMYVIQIPRLKEMATQTQLEKVLDVFSQNKYKTNDAHVLEYTGDMSSPEVAQIVRYLHRAIADDDIRRQMIAEDEEQAFIDGLEAKIDFEREAKEKAIAKAERAKEEAKQAKKEAKQAKKELKQANANADKAKAEVIKARTDAAKARADANKAIEDVAKTREDTNKAFIEIDVLKKQFEEFKKNGKK